MCSVCVAVVLLSAVFKEKQQQQQQQEEVEEVEITSFCVFNNFI